MQNNKEAPASGLVSRNILIDGRRTSVRLEPEMWIALRDIASREGGSIHELCTLVSMCKRPHSTLTAAIRVFLMLYYRSATTDDGHNRAGHGDITRMRERAGRLRPANVNHHQDRDTPRMAMA
jgi:predicted DNA-binding ribbon-helix-helix protein